MKKLSSYSVLAAMGLFSLGCGKKSSETPAPSKTDMLTNKNWIATAITVSPALPVGGTLVTDYYAQLQSCSKDDFIRFETPNTYKEDEGNVKCNTADPQTVLGTWTFNGDQTVITTSANTPQGTVTQSYNVVELSDATFKYSVGVPSNGVTYTLTVTNRKL